jgi:hypothetical protein
MRSELTDSSARNALDATKCRSGTNHFAQCPIGLLRANHEAILSYLTQAAENVGLQIWDFINESHRAEKNEGERETLRSAANAFLFDADVRKSDEPIVRHASALAHAVLDWLLADATPEGFKRLERASRKYEEFRISYT